MNNFSFYGNMKYYIGVDVGTGSVRSAIFDSHGNLVTIATEEIKIWTPSADYYEQSSFNIWNAVIHTIKVPDKKKIARKKLR